MRYGRLAITCTKLETVKKGSLSSNGSPIVRIFFFISDVIMPKMGGREACGGCGEALYPGIRILFLSGYAVTAPKGNGDWLRDRLFVAKPFSREELLRSVRTCLNTPGISPQRDINREGSVKEMK